MQVTDGRFLQEEDSFPKILLIQSLMSSSQMYWERWRSIEILHPNMHTLLSKPRQFYRTCKCERIALDENLTRSITEIATTSQVGWDCCRKIHSSEFHANAATFRAELSVRARSCGILQGWNYAISGSVITFRSLRKRQSWRARERERDIKRDLHYWGYV